MCSNVSCCLHHTQLHLWHTGLGLHFLSRLPPTAFPPLYATCKRAVWFVYQGVLCSCFEFIADHVHMVLSSKGHMGYFSGGISTTYYQPLSWRDKHCCLMCDFITVYLFWKVLAYIIKGGGRSTADNAFGQ